MMTDDCGEIQAEVEQSMREKLGEATGLSFELAYESIGGEEPRDTDKIFGEEASDKIWAYVDGWRQDWIAKNIEGRTSLKAMMEFDIAKEEKRIEKDIEFFKGLKEKLSGRDK